MRSSALQNSYQLPCAQICNGVLWLSALKTSCVQAAARGNASMVQGSGLQAVDSEAHRQQGAYAGQVRNIGPHAVAVECTSTKSRYYVHQSPRLVFRQT